MLLRLLFFSFPFFPFPFFSLFFFFFLFLFFPFSLFLSLSPLPLSFPPPLFLKVEGVHKTTVSELSRISFPLSPSRFLIVFVIYDLCYLSRFRYLLIWVLAGFGLLIHPFPFAFFLPPLFSPFFFPPPPFPLPPPVSPPPPLTSLPNFPTYLSNLIKVK